MENNNIIFSTNSFFNEFYGFYTIIIIIKYILKPFIFKYYQWYYVK